MYRRSTKILSKYANVDRGKIQRSLNSVAGVFHATTIHYEHIVLNSWYSRVEASQSNVRFSTTWQPLTISIFLVLLK